MAYNSSHTGAQIDSAVGTVIEKESTWDSKQDGLRGKKGQFVGFTSDNVPGAVDAPSGGVNPNLLDNWYFGRPVNQRGQTEYAGDKYTVDRWHLTTDGVLTVADEGIRLTSGALFEPFEYELSSFLKGKTVTYSFFFADNTLVTKSAVIPSTWGNWDSLIEIGDIQLIGLESGKRIWARYSSTTTAVAAKLELGSTQTLAHKEGDKWVLNEIPDFGEQLRRCQRYAVDDNYHTTVGQLNYDGDTYYISVQLPCVMRTTPVITLKEISAIGWGVLPISDAEITWRGANGFFVAIKDLSSMNNFIGKACSVTYFASADL